MALTFHPAARTILICNFNTGFKPPEMVKRRPVIVVSPRLRKRDSLCSVVPLSTTEPLHVMPYHCELNFTDPLPVPWNSQTMWVKADMIATVSFERLNLMRLPRVAGQPRRYIQPKISDDEFYRVKKAILYGLGIKNS